MQIKVKFAYFIALVNQVCSLLMDFLTFMNAYLKNN